MTPYFSRNRGIANVFMYMNIIESWGSGIPRMIQECTEYGLEEPELIDAEGDFRINLYRKDPIAKAFSKAVKPHAEALDEALNESLVKKLWLLLRENPKLTQKEIASQLEISRATVQRLTKELLKQGQIERKGGKRHGYWVTIE